MVTGGGQVAAAAGGVGSIPHEVLTTIARLLLLCVLHKLVAFLGPGLLLVKVG